VSGNTVAILSMLHERPDVNSATRMFRTSPVVRWTVDRLCRTKSVANVGILCWEDQLDAVVPIAEHEHVDVLVKGPRRAIPELDRVTAARKWADGWRGGLHSTCWFDEGFYAPWAKELAEKLNASRVVLVPPASAMVDPVLIDAMVTRSVQDPSPDLVFTAAAPGLAGAVLSRAMLDQLVKAQSHPGRSLHYMPEQPILDPVGRDACVTAPAAVARTTENFLLDCARKIRRFTSAAHALDGSLMATGAEELVQRLANEPTIDELPREITLELNTDRSTAPVYWAGKPEKIDRADIAPSIAENLFGEPGGFDEVRLTIGGVGDPVRSPTLFDVIASARARGVRSIHVETDLVEGDETVIARLAAADVDVVSVFMPALTPQTYASVMGVDAMTRVLTNLKTFVSERARRGAGVPIVVPTFVKLAQNLAEMDAWYDQWLTAVGSAVIVGPQRTELDVADMSPARRRPCARLSSRVTVLSDGRVVSCENDVSGKQALGRIGETSLSEIWTDRFGCLRADHAAGAWHTHAVCAGCKAWHKAA
jgi:radical SAM protein with 4Fe4S-binding SPASM domain